MPSYPALSAVTQVVPLFGVTDIERSRAFYVDSLGFTMPKRWIDGGRLRWCWLELGGAALMLQEFVHEGPHRNVPDAPLGTGVSLYFVCFDAIALFKAFRSRGVEAQVPFVGNGMWVTQVVDPDGYKLFFESPTTEPEETVYSERP